jgi:hypothetical protein
MDNQDRFTTPAGICPSCGLIALDSPHARSDQCIRALEAEVARLGELLEQVKDRHARILAAGPGARKR